MKRILQAGGAALALALATMGSAQQAAPAPRAEAKASTPSQQMADLYVAEGRAPGIVIAYAKGDTPAKIAAAGHIALDPGAPAADADSLWRVYSMTKPITGIAAMMLIEEGKLKLDQPISDFFPGFRSMKVLTDPDKSLASRPAAREITVRHLLTHTAGLGYSIVTKGPLLEEYNRLGINPAAVSAAMEPNMRIARAPSLKVFAERVATLPLVADPGTKWSYSIGLDLLGAVIEQASGMPFDRFLQTRLFDPLKMRSTGFTVPAANAARLSTNYLWLGDKMQPMDPGATSAWLSPPSFPYGGAGLAMSAHDYDRFLHMLLNEGELDGVRVLKPETVRLAMSNLLPDGVTFGGVSGSTGGESTPKMGYGAGGSVYLEDVPGGAGKGTYGWGGAAGTAAWVDPTHKVRGTVMVNYFPADKWPVRADAVKAIYAELTPAAQSTPAAR